MKQPGPQLEEVPFIDHDTYVLISGLITALVVVGATWWYVKRSNLKASEVEEGKR
jgi:hypothetical protein